MKVTNHCQTVLGVPRVGPIAPGQSREIPDGIAANNIVSAWIARGMLVIEGKAPAAVAPEPASNPDQPDDKDALIAELGELGIVRDKRTSIANLRKTLEEAKAEQDKSGDD